MKSHRPTRRESAAAEWCSTRLHPLRSFPVVQMFTVAQLLKGEAPDIPRWGLDTHRKAAKTKGKAPEQFVLDEDTSSGDE